MATTAAIAATRAREKDVSEPTLAPPVDSTRPSEEVRSGLMPAAVADNSSDLILSEPVGAVKQDLDTSAPSLAEAPLASHKIDVPLTGDLPNPALNVSDQIVKSADDPAATKLKADVIEPSDSTLSPRNKISPSVDKAGDVHSVPDLLKNSPQSLKQSAERTASPSRPVSSHSRAVAFTQPFHQAEHRAAAGSTSPPAPTGTQPVFISPAQSSPPPAPLPPRTVLHALLFFVK